MNITKHTRFSTVLALPEFQEFCEYLNPFEWPKRQLVKPFALNQFRHTWQVQQICDGFNYLQAVCQSGTKVFYPLYKEPHAPKEPGIEARVMFHLPVAQKAKFAVICAGGAYRSVCSMVEAFPAAQKLNALGYHCFVVNYRVGRYAKAPNPQDDLAAAVAYILQHAEALHIQTEGYAVMGFSAGGHLAASFGAEATGYRHYGLPRPGCLLLGYPAVTMTDLNARWVRKTFLGAKQVDDPALIRLYSVEQQVTGAYPPVFVWHCAEDKVASPQNSWRLVKQLNTHGIPVEHRVYPGSAHGWGNGDGTSAEGWIDLAAAFWERQTGTGEADGSR